MPHYCRHCGRMRANERFSGHGHAAHLCRDCGRLPTQDIQAADDLLAISHFLLQSHISPKNMKQLDKFCQSSNAKVARAATLVKQVGKRYPYKRRRRKSMLHGDRGLLDELAAADLVPDYFCWFPPASTASTTASTPTTLGTNRSQHQVSMTPLNLGPFQTTVRTTFHFEGATARLPIPVLHGFLIFHHDRRAV